MLGSAVLLVALVVVVLMVVCRYKPAWCPSCVSSWPLVNGRSLLGSQSGGANGTGGTNAGGTGGTNAGPVANPVATVANPTPVATVAAPATMANQTTGEPYNITASGVFEPKPHTVMTVYADWCGYSERFIKGHYRTFESNHAHDDLGLVKVEVSNGPLYSAVEKYLKAHGEEVMGFPTVYYVTPRGNVKVNNLGRTPEKLEEFVNQNKTN